MAVVFAGGEFEAFESHEVFDREDSQWVTTGGRYDSNYSRGACAVANLCVLQGTFPGQTVGSLTFQLYMDAVSNSSQDDALVELFDVVNNRPALTIDGVNGVYTFRRYNGATLTNVGAALTSGVSGSGSDVESGILQSWTITWDIGVSGKVELFINGVSKRSFSGDTTDLSSLDAFHLRSSARGSNTLFAHYSEVVVADVEDTVGWRLGTLGVNANSATNNAWMNGEPEVDDVGTPSDLTLIRSGTTGQVQGFVCDNLPAGATGMDVKAIAVAARGKVGSSVVTNVQAHTRSDGTDYFSADLVVKDTNIQPFRGVFDQNPDTTADWTQSEVNAAEFGLRSQT